MSDSPLIETDTNSMSTSPEWWVGRRVLVAGGSGFIGRHLISALRRRFVKHILLVGRQTPVGISGEDVEWLKLDLRNAAAVQTALKHRRFDIAFNLAGQIDQSVRPGIYGELFAANVTTALNLAESVEREGLSAFVHVGSNAEYGDADCPQGCDSQERPNSAYGVSKLAATRLMLAKARSEGLPAMVVRPFLVYGNGMMAKSFLGRALNCAKSGEPFPTTGGEQTRDFVSVARVVSTLLWAASKGMKPGQVVNACTGVEIRLRDVMELIRSVLPTFGPVIGAVPYPPTELMRSVGVPMAPLPRQVAIDELMQFIRSGNHP